MTIQAKLDSNMLDLERSVAIDKGRIGGEIEADDLTRLTLRGRWRRGGVCGEVEEGLEGR